MKECEEHDYGKWSLGLWGSQYYGKEIRSCRTCGASQIRPIEGDSKEKEND